MRRLLATLAVLCALGVAGPAPGDDDPPSLRESMRRVGHGVRDVTRETGHAVRDAARDVNESTRDTREQVADESEGVLARAARGLADALDALKAAIASDD